MKNKAIFFLLLVALILFPASAAAAADFSSDPDAIEGAAQSVLMLEVYDSDYELIATGSGFVAFDSRTLVTNYHVIDEAAWLIANSDDGDQYIVSELLTADEEKDIAICAFSSPTDLKPLEFNSQGKLKRGERIVAIGSPIGITNTVSMGNISALYQEGNVSWIQFTAPISSGSSGGALFDDNGHVIGITSAYYIDTQNLNLAVHISEVEALYGEWIDQESPFPGFTTGNDRSSPPEATMSPEDRLDYFLEKRASPEPAATPEDKIDDPPTDDAAPNATMSPEDRLDYFLKNRATATPPPSQTPFSPDGYDETVIVSSLKRGDSGENVKALQTELIRLGYLDGPADGVFDEKTELAVIAFNHQVYSSTSKTAGTEMQKLLFGGTAPEYKEPPVSLCIIDEAHAQWEELSSDRLKIRFEVTNISKSSPITAFEIYVYAKDVWGDALYGDNVYCNTTTKTVQPGETVYSDYIEIPKQSKISTVYCGINEVTDENGVVKSVPSVEYFIWLID